MKFLKKIFILMYKIIYNSVYRIVSLTKRTNKHKAIFVISRDTKLQGNLLYLYDELQKNYPQIKIHFIFAGNKMNLSLFKEIFSFVDAKYIILDDYYLPIYLIKPKSNVKVIQVWHAAGAFKKFGWSTVGTKFGPSKEYLDLIPIHSNYTHVYVSSENIIPYYAEAFNMQEEKIFSLGIPRVDMFKNKKVKEMILNKIKSKYNFVNNIKEKVIVLIAPTYRAEGRYGESQLNIVNELYSISRMLNDNIQIIFKPHPYTNNKDIDILKKCSNLTILQSDFTLNDWMLFADVFITDYSSAIFDFSILKRPFAHFVPDLEEYQMNRGFYNGIEELSDGEIIKDLNTLVAWINKRTKNEKFDTSRMVRRNFSNMNTRITKDIVEHFIQN